jgi:hypothetical protein
MSGGSRNVLGGLSRGFSAFTKRICHTESPDLSNKIASAVILGVILIFSILVGIGAINWAIGVIGDARKTISFNHLSTAEHLIQAKAACGNGSQCANIPEAWRHIQKIPVSAPEHEEAFKLLTAIQQQEDRDNIEAEKKEAREKEEAPQKSWEQMQRNIHGDAHDNYLCGTSTQKEPIVSFDNGKFWWKDDGRCAERQQKRRDEDAQIYSYWSTTVRVNTDMDSSWLPNEERTCQTHPDEKGRVDIVVCNLMPEGIWGVKHNIPVKFWGGVDRNTVSDWKCRREGDTFVCRAID